MAKDEKDFYGYDPSIAAASTTIVVFAILTALHLYRLLRTRTWFCLPFTIGALCMRIAAHFVLLQLTFL